MYSPVVLNNTVAEFSEGIVIWPYQQPLIRVNMMCRYQGAIVGCTPGKSATKLAALTLRSYS